MDAASSVVFLNGRFVPRAEATLDIEDRGTLFADGIYEVLRYYGGKPLAMAAHEARLSQSMAAISLAPTEETRRFEAICDELVARNQLQEAKVYWQVTRGVAPREHVFPKVYRPTVLAIAYPAEPIDPTHPPRAGGAILAADERWHRCDIKSLMLLPNVLAKNRALEAGAQEAILHRSGTVTEGTSTSLCIVQNGALWTHPANQWILGGITRSILLDLARKAGIAACERTFTIEQLLAADEVFICGSTTHVMSITHVDGQPIGGGQIGTLTTRLNRLFLEHIAQVCR